MSLGIGVDRLDFRYRTGSPVLTSVSADFPPGSMTAITGPSGCGKSTLLYLIGLMVRPTGGSISLGGERVDDLDDVALSRLRAHTFGFVFQDAVLDGSRTVLDNALETSLYRATPRGDDTPAALALLERFGVSDLAQRRPRQLSGGQAQRIALCRALLSRPSVLLADEPTGNLDADTGETVLAALQDHARQGAAVVVATHEQRIVERCDAILALSRG